jgi:hypothetical protein
MLSIAAEGGDRAGDGPVLEALNLQRNTTTKGRTQALPFHDSMLLEGPEQKKITQGAFREYLLHQAGLIPVSWVLER